MTTRPQPMKKQHKQQLAAYYEKYLDYIKKAGGKPLVEWFDDDWAPLGKSVREEMEAVGLTRVIEGRVYDAR